MTLILEAIALASRDYVVEELDSLLPHGGATIYYMSPSQLPGRYCGCLGEEMCGHGCFGILWKTV